MGDCVGYWVNNIDLSPQLIVSSLLHNLELLQVLTLFGNGHVITRLNNSQVKVLPVNIVNNI